MTRTALDVMVKVFGAVFGVASRRAWVVCAAAIFGLVYGLDAADQALLLRCLGRSTPPTTQALEAWLIIGRRGGKSHFAAFLLAFMACFREYHLAPGERGVAMMIAADRRQARVVKRYVSGLLRSVPMLAALIVNETLDSIELSNGITIEIHSASFRTLRGYTVVFAVCDEVAFWPTGDSANPDAEILNALRPAMATVPGAMLVVISSPYARRGELYRAHREHFGHDDDPVLVWQADTRTMNPLVPQAVIDRAYADDAASAGAEYGAQFRSDVDAFVSRDVLDAVTVQGRRELPPVPGTTYSAFFDAAGGSGADSQTLGIAHDELRDGAHVAVLDCVREVRPPFSPEGVLNEFVDLLKSYRLSRVTSDRYAADWPREQWKKRGIDCVASDKTASELFHEFLPLANSRRVELLDVPRLVTQLAALERRTARAGRDLICHPPAGHDDLAVAAVGAVVNSEHSESGWLQFIREELTKAKAEAAV